MEPKTQKRLRFIVPGVLLYALLVWISWVTRWYDLPIPEKWEETPKLFVVIVLSGIYYVTGLRERSNAHYHMNVNQTIIKKLTTPFKKDIPDAQWLAWNKARLIFYKLIDNDKSLTEKSGRIRFNGLLWTSVADIRAVSILGIVLFSLAIVASRYFEVAKFDESRTGAPLMILSAIFLITFWLSKILTRRHLEISEEQCDHILLYHREELKSKLAEAVSGHD